MLRLQIKEAQWWFHPGFSEICACVFHICFLLHHLLVNFISTGNIPKTKIKSSWGQKTFCRLQLWEFCTVCISCSTMGQMETFGGVSHFIKDGRIWELEVIQVANLWQPRRHYWTNKWQSKHLILWWKKAITFKYDSLDGRFAAVSYGWLIYTSLVTAWMWSLKLKRYWSCIGCWILLCTEHYLHTMWITYGTA